MSHLEKEIGEQPAVLARFLAEQREPARKLATWLKRTRFSHIFIVARGSSDNAALYAKYLFGMHNRMVVALAAPSMFTMYQKPPALDGAAVLAISQSGRSDDLCSVVEHARRKGRPTIAITNSPRSPLASQAEMVIALGAGTERAVAATKSYTAQLMAIALVSASLEGSKRHLEMLKRVPERVAALLGQAGTISRGAERYRYCNHLFVIGRGFNYCTAFEIALKLKELAYVGAESYSSADFRHGPIAALEPGHPVLLVAPRGRCSSDIESLVKQLEPRRAELLVISDIRRLQKRARLAMPLLAGGPEWLSPIEAVVPGQILACEFARQRGHDLDRPRGLSKVTVTR